MTDRFEEAVRQAAHGLGAAGTDIPSYHDAWHRGRRRRFVKRSALAVAGALVFIVAVSVNLSNVPGSDPTQVDDVATGAVAVTPSFEPTPLATTSPVETPAAIASDVVPSLPVPTVAGIEVAPNDQGAAATSSPVPTNGPTAAVPAPTVPPPTPAAIVTATPAPQTEPAPSVVVATPEPTANPADTDQGPDDTSAAGTDTGATVPDVTPAPALTTIVPQQTADAALTGLAARGVSLPCDRDGDEVVDAACTLLPDYACAGEGDIDAGYEAIDTDDDGVIDTCVAVGLTTCDTTGDSIGDTPCIIELNTDGGTADPVPLVKE